MPAFGILYTGFTLYRSIFAVYLVTGIEWFYSTGNVSVYRCRLRQYLIRVSLIAATGPVLGSADTNNRVNLQASSATFIRRRKLKKRMRIEVEGGCATQGEPA